MLLQVRPALFAVARNEALSLANHKEILGDPPSPWIVSVLTRAGDDALGFFASAEPAVATWKEAYAIELAGRTWMNIGFFFRLMDRFGMPRTLVLDSIGGKAESAGDTKWFPVQLLRAMPGVLRLQWTSLQAIMGVHHGFRELDRRLASAKRIEALFEVNVALMAFALRTNFAINGALAVLIRVRKKIGIPGAAEIITRKMMEEYEALRSTDSGRSIEQNLDSWLGRYGHRGPLESDPANPRFAEMRDVLLMDLSSRLSGEVPAMPTASRPQALWRPLFWLDERREWFRDSLMRRWRIVRSKLLEEAGRLAREGKLESDMDIFYLQAQDLNDIMAFRDTVRRNRVAWEASSALSMPLSSTRSEIQALLLDRRATAPGVISHERMFPGIALSAETVEGRVVKAHTLMELLARSNADPTLLSAETILVVPCLEPSWAIVFPRVGGVAADIGGELSHAAILLREARRPAVVNCSGLFAAVQEGSSIRLNGILQCVELL